MTAHVNRCPRMGGWQNGMTLIEVLVTLVIVSIGLLGVAGLHLTSLKSNQESYARSQASILAADILDRIRANQAGFLAGEYDSIALNGTGATGTHSGNDLLAWQNAIDRILPGGAADAAGRIVANGNGAGATHIVTITIQWSERADRATNRNAELVQFVTRSEI